MTRRRFTILVFAARRARVFVAALFGSAESRLLLLVLFQLFILWLVDEYGRKKLSLFQQLDLFGI